MSGRTASHFETRRALSCDFSGSYDEDGEIISYRTFVNDDKVSDNNIPSFYYSVLQLTGENELRLVVEDNKGKTSEFKYIFDLNDRTEPELKINCQYTKDYQVYCNSVGSNFYRENVKELKWSISNSIFFGDSFYFKPTQGGRYEVVASIVSNGVLVSKSVSISVEKVFSDVYTSLNIEVLTGKPFVNVKNDLYVDILNGSLYDLNLTESAVFFNGHRLTLDLLKVESNTKLVLPSSYIIEGKNIVEFSILDKHSKKLNKTISFYAGSKTLEFSTNNSYDFLNSKTLIVSSFENEEISVENQKDFENFPADQDYLVISKSGTKLAIGKVDKSINTVIELNVVDTSSLAISNNIDFSNGTTGWVSYKGLLEIGSSWDANLQKIVKAISPKYDPNGEIQYATKFISSSELDSFETKLVLPNLREGSFAVVALKNITKNKVAFNYYFPNNSSNKEQLGETLRVNLEQDFGDTIELEVFVLNNGYDVLTSSIFSFMNVYADEIDENIKQLQIFEKDIVKNLSITRNDYSQIESLSVGEFEDLILSEILDLKNNDALKWQFEDILRIMNEVPENFDWSKLFPYKIDQDTEVGSNRLKYSSSYKLLGADSNNVIKALPPTLLISSTDKTEQILAYSNKVIDRNIFVDYNQQMVYETGTILFLNNINTNLKRVQLYFCPYNTTNLDLCTVVKHARTNSSKFNTTKYLQVPWSLRLPSKVADKVARSFELGGNYWVSNYLYNSLSGLLSNFSYDTCSIAFNDIDVMNGGLYKPHKSGHKLGYNIDVVPMEMYQDKCTRYKDITVSEGVNKISYPDSLEFGIKFRNILEKLDSVNNYHLAYGNIAYNDRSSFYRFSKSTCVNNRRMDEYLKKDSTHNDHYHAQFLWGEISSENKSLDICYKITPNISESENLNLYNIKIDSKFCDEKYNLSNDLISNFATLNNYEPEGICRMYHESAIKEGYSKMIVDISEFNNTINLDCFTQGTLSVQIKSVYKSDQNTKDITKKEYGCGQHVVSLPVVKDAVYCDGYVKNSSKGFVEVGDISKGFVEPVLEDFSKGYTSSGLHFNYWYGNLVVNQHGRYFDYSVNKTSAQYACEGTIVKNSIINGTIKGKSEAIDSITESVYDSKVYQSYVDEFGLKNVILTDSILIRQYNNFNLYNKKIIDDKYYFNNFNLDKEFCHDWMLSPLWSDEETVAYCEKYAEEPEDRIQFKVDYLSGVKVEDAGVAIE